MNGRFFSDTLYQQAQTVLNDLSTHGKTLALAESCTGGLLSALLTEIPGSSKVFTHGYVSYANAAKVQMLGVDPALIAEHGAVSEPVARAMADGALQNSGVDFALSITGIAGPDGGSAAKPVGLVFIGLASKDGTTAHQYHFAGDRQAIRLQTVSAAVSLLIQQASLR